MNKNKHNDKKTLRDNTTLEKKLYESMIEAGLIIPQTEEDIRRAEKALEQIECPPLPPELSDPYLIINELDELNEDDRDDVSNIDGYLSKRQPLRLVHSLGDEDPTSALISNKPYLGYVSDETGEPPSAITQGIGTSRPFLILVTQNSNSVDDCIRDEIADRTVKKWPQLNRDHVLTSLKTSSERIAASRNKPYSSSILSFEQILDRSGMSEEEKDYWRKLGERYDSSGFLKYARQKARECRKLLGSSSENLLGRIEKYLWDKYHIELCDVDASEIDDSHAEVHPDQNSLLYDKQLLEQPDKMLYYIAHELGHLELHSRLLEHDREPDPVYGSIYNNSGPNSLTRYNPRSQEEAEANAFAAEFLCSSDEAFRLWRSDSLLDTREVAKRMGAPAFVVRAQLAEALYQYTYTSDLNKSQTPKKRFKCDASQESAAKSTGQPVLVDAGPGTGKTATLIGRVQFLLEELKEKPESLLVLTFSNEATAELEERIASTFGKALAARIKISTFHGFGLSILQLHGQFQDIDANACVLDEAGQIELATSVIGKVSCHKILKLSKPQDTVQEVVRHIEFLKDRLYTPDLFEQALNNWQPEQDEESELERARIFLEIFREYEKAKDESQRLDFADLILKPIELLRKESDVRNAYREKYKWVMVDEYQDVSRATAILLQQICGRENPPWVVGDKRQSIFRFRGAAPENVDEFENDFQGAVKFSLGINYRSCEEVVSTASRLAYLMVGGADGSSVKRLWETSPSNPKAFSDRAISIAIADSDRAEQEGIAKQIEQWLTAGVKHDDIAVLARRNVDVRNIVLSLGKLDIKATTHGLVTAEGAAGDLANIITFADKPIASLPRLAFNLGHGGDRKFSTETINEVVMHLRNSLEETGELNEEGIVDGKELVIEIKRLYECLQREKFTGDAFTMICAFLFDGSDYLRWVLALTDEVEKSLALNEVVTTLAQASTYRLSHSDVPAKVSRKGFSKFFRESISSSAPCLTPPKAEVEAVKVMTCHAAKGLEFPFVMVAGQARSTRLKNKGYKWLPPNLKPNAEEDEQQADSVLFVGATRAQRELLVSYASTSSGLQRAEKRAVTPLLSAWCTQPDVQPIFWPSTIVEKDYVELGGIWGGTLGQPLAARSLDKEYCSLNTYLRDYAAIKFPSNDKPMYPIFHTTVRRAMQKIVELANTQKVSVDNAVAQQILLEEWEKEVDPNHPHCDLYYHTAKTYIEKFADGFIPEEGHIEYMNPTVYESKTRFPVRLDLVSLYRVNKDAPTAILFRPESLKEHNREKGLLWGALKPPSRRIAFVLLREIEPMMRPIVFSGEDGAFYNYQWSNRKADLEKEIERVQSRFKSFAQGYFAEEVEPFICDKCESRIACPHWIKALA
jgi:superfamily I DNA/RNA helicase